MTNLRLTNWASNYTFSAARVQHPRTLEQVQEIVATAEKVHVLGSRHSFNGIADSSQLISLSELPTDITIDADARTVACAAWLSLGALAQALDQAGWALRNLPSLPHISLAGALATATHGSGNTNGNLATAVTAVELITSDGEILQVCRGDPEFEGVVVGLGALGAVTRVTLEVEPSYAVGQRVFERLGWRALFDHFDAVTSSGYSVSLFTRWGESLDQVWVKTRPPDSTIDDDFFGAAPASVNLHPIAGMDPANCTPQLGLPGPWWDRLPHFRMGFTPSVGHELQSEYIAPRKHAIAALEAVRALADRMAPLLQVAEIRTVAEDRLWLSPQYGRDTVAMHFTWKPDAVAVSSLLVALESVLEPFEARPHWGKLFAARGAALSSLYPRLSDFLTLRQRLDPREAFRNVWFDTHLG